MKKLLFRVLLLSHFFGYAQYTLIPDVNFEKDLIFKGIDIEVPDGQVLTENVNGVTDLNIASQNITDLTGIQDFLALTSLDCRLNQLTSLNVSKNTSLEKLYCMENQLTSLDVSKNIILSQLHCRLNKLISLNLKNGNNKNLLALDVTFNPNLNCIQVDNKSYSDANWATLKDATASYSEDCSKIAPITPPEITATGNQTFCPGTSLNIVESINIKFDPLEPTTDAVYIQISSGYTFGQDLLSLTGSHPTVSSTWNSLEGKLKLFPTTGSKIPYTDFEAAIADVKYSNSSTSPSGTRTFSISLGVGQLSYLPSNKHFYEYVPALGITWTNAKVAAAAKSYYGLQGYLATLTAADETQLAGAQAPGAGWIGGSDAQTEGVWRWVTGPEGLTNGGTGIVFWNGVANGSTPNFAFWNTGEPNQAGDEDYAHITSPGVGIPGSWNDLKEAGDPIANYNYYPKGYIVEYGGMVTGDVDNLKISASTTITIPKITSSTPKNICGSGVVTLQATATDGIVRWYDKPTGGTLLQTGNSFTTPSLSSSTSFYVDASNGSCPSSQRTEIIATINSIPTITTTPNSRCGSGTVTLGAVASAGTINWYDAPSGGTSKGTGNTFITPNISTPTTYYVEATSAGCTSLTRIPVLATVNNYPTITTTPNSRCGSGSVTLGAVASAGIIYWYDAPTGGTLLQTGNSFTTPSLSSSTSFYVDASNGSCPSSQRTEIIATINSIPTITTTPNSRCGSGTVTLGAVASAGTINWYDAPSGGTSKGTGNTFITPNISVTTPYYVEATAAGCTTLTRTPILATVNNSPTITTTPNSRCDSGTVTLGAVASAGTIYWYDAPSGGTSKGTGNTFTTPNISVTTPYYVEATLAGCTSPRKLVLATIYPIQNLSEEVVLCQTKKVTLDASISGMKYLWSPSGETTQTISVSSIGDYSVTISSPIGNCHTKKKIKVIEYPKPIIKEIIVTENSITIQLEHPQDYYEYAIDGRFFQDSNQFSYIPSGQHTGIVRDKKMCNFVSQAFTIFTIPKYFTPNNDHYNDVWEIKEMRDFPNSTALIFNRYGKLIKTLTASSYSWDGKFNNELLPADDYWYRLKLDDFKPEIKGHFYLKR